MANQVLGLGAADDQNNQNQPQVDVLLTWSDFLHSLEVLRNKPYSGKCHQRDWFRLNPLDIVLLGCKTIKSRLQACRKISHTFVGIEDISLEILRKPRILEHILSCLQKILLYSGTASHVVQQCCVALVDIYEASLQSSTLKGVCNHWYFTALCPIIVKLSDSEHVTGHPTTRVKLKWLIDTMQNGRSKSSVKQLVADCENHPLGLMLNTIQGVFDEVPDPVAYQVMVLKESVPMLKVADGFFDNILHTSSFPKILLHLKHSELEYGNGVRILLNIFQVAVKELVDKDLALAKHVNFAKDEHVSQAEIFASAGVASDNADPNRINLIEMFLDLLEQIEKQLAQCILISGANTRVPSKILELVFVSLSSHSLEQSLKNTLEFFRQPLSLLMIYASEDYLTQGSTTLLLELLDFTCCAIEMDLQLHDVLTNFIPNLFGPVFGVHDDRVLCKVLEFGKLALKSRQRKKLLWEGITRVVKVYKIFQPIQILRSKVHHFRRKVEAVQIALDILDDVVERCLTLFFAQSDDNKMISPTSADAKGPHFEIQRTDTATTSSTACSAEEVADDETIRVEILVQLFELANAMVGSGNDIFYVFVSVLPRVLTPVSLLRLVDDENVARIIGDDAAYHVEGFIPWHVDHRSFARVLLGLCAAAEQSSACSVFQLCAVVLPKLVKNLDAAELKDDKKMELIEDIYKLIHDSLLAGNDVDILVLHGIPLMSQLLPASSSPHEMRVFMEQMAKQLTKASFSSVLLLVSNACDFMLTNFPADSLDIQRLFLFLLKRGKRDDVRNVARLCNKTLCHPQMEFVRSYLYSHAVGELTSRQLAELSEILVSVNGLASRNQHVRDSSELEGEKLVLKRIIEALTDTIVIKLKVMLEENAFEKTTWSELHDCITKVSVCVPLLTSNELVFWEHTEESFNLEDFMCRKFPSAVLQDKQLMDEIGTVSRRVQAMQTPRYDAFKELVVRSLNVFLALDTKHGSDEGPVTNDTSKEDTSKEAARVDKGLPNNTSDESATLSEDNRQLREACLAGFLLRLARNTEARDRLMRCGYSAQLWQAKPSVQVSTSGTRCLEENLRDNLVACFAGYQDLLREIGIARVDVDGKQVQVDDLFDPIISSVAELKGRRAIATRLIDKHIAKQNDLNLMNSKNVLLATEDAIEEKFEEEARKPCKPITFTACVNTSFFDCARCCGSKIIGCYAPSGVHCERPLEIGIRQDSGFASIYDETGSEIENCELLFTDQGVYVFRAYTNSHPYDTSQVWIKLFTVLLADPSPYVPAVIVPHLHPSVTTWNALRREIPAELTGCILSCDFDFSLEWQTYYDFKPECVRGGKDIVLKPGFDISLSEKGSAFLERQLSVENKDLGGLIFEHVMNVLCEDIFLKQFRFLGTSISLYITNFLENGYETPSIVSERFDYERWLTRCKNSTPDGMDSKDQIIHSLTELIQSSISSFCAMVDYEGMFMTKRHQLFQLKAFFLAKKRVGDPRSDKSVCEIDTVVKRNCEMVLIQGLEDSLQEEIIHWIFRNEDRVWRFRGGSDGHETLEQFMRFLGRENEPRWKSFPGVVVFARRDTRPFGVRDIVAYAIGEYGHKRENIEEEHDEEEEEDVAVKELITLKESAYEVVTAWVHPRFRGLNLAVEMYIEVCRHVSAPFMVCDVLQGSLERIACSTWLFATLDRLGVRSWFVRYRQRSYHVITQSGEEEQFEKIVIRRNMLGFVVTLYDCYLAIKSRTTRRIMIVGVTASIAAIASYYYCKSN